MKRSLIFSVAVVFYTTAQEISLFNGIDLQGWNIHGTELWYVEDGHLVCESSPQKEYGYLVTQDHFQDFILNLEFKQESKSDNNSGVFVRSTIEGIRISGWQVEVAPKGRHTGGIYESYGRGWLIKPEPELEEVLNENEWNALKIKVDGDQITTWLNGTQMIHLEDEKIGAGKGSIALQIHDGGGIKIRWREIKLEPIVP
ncbi:MAG: DUF1080 domain-containing protein [Flavobacteriaceae bacterium]|nr:DUF1080 domain-containing protein [Flavobacteriaceae bacterium]MCY4266485.1 DUF1080 domain-containing protein [Flavobacteriaceae bacterium]MCY4298416.1 DUF1080 domain-containing protein [Flavobacteriaceae bacterium]